MKNINAEIDVGKGGDITIYKKATFQDRVLFYEEGHSVLYPLVINLQALMISDTKVDTSPYNAHDPGWALSQTDSYYPIFNAGSWGFDNVNAYQEINGLSGGNPVTVDASNSIFESSNYGEPDPSDGVALAIFGIQGDDALNGYHPDVNFVNETTFEINNESLSGSEDISRAYVAPMIRFGYIADHRSQGYHPALNDPQIVLGRDGSANGIDKYVMEDLIPDGTSDNTLQYNPITLNEPDIDLGNQTGIIRISREVDNQGTVGIPVKEVALYVNKMSEQNSSTQVRRHEMLSREVVDLNISSGSVVSFTYEFEINSSISGGVMSNFIQMLYRHFSNGNRTVDDIDNVNQSDGPRRDQYDVRSRDGHLDRNIGVQVGTGTTDVDIEDYNLDSRVPYGENDGELWPAGSWVSKIVFDQGNNEAYFDIVRIFENQGSTSIDLNETGLYTNGPSGPTMIFRHKLDSTTTVAAGETVQARYRVNVSV